MDYSNFTGRQGALKFPELAVGFDFGRNLPRADFPKDFVDAYIYYFTPNPDWDDERDCFLAHYPSGPAIIYFEAIDDPAHIRSQNAILADSIYAEPGSQILPHGFYSFGTAFDDRGYLHLMVCLEPDCERYGHIYVWRRAHDPLGEGDNTEPMGFVARSLREFIDGLAREEDL